MLEFCPKLMNHMLPPIDSQNSSLQSQQIIQQQHSPSLEVATTLSNCIGQTGKRI